MMISMESSCFFLHKISNRDANGIIKNSLRMPGSRGRIGPGEVKGQRPCGGPKGAKPPERI